MQRELAWNASQLNAQGLFVTDSSDGSTWNLENLTGAETDVNALYYQALTDGAMLASAAGQAPAAAGYRTSAAALRTAINANLWDPALGAYDASTSSRGFVSQDANVLPVLFGVASSRDVPTILATVRSALATPFGAERVSTPVPSGYNQDISPFMGSSQIWGDFTGNDTTDAMTLLSDEWGYMAANDPGSTDWERFQPDGTVNGGGTSWAHGWSTGDHGPVPGRVRGQPGEPRLPGVAGSAASRHAVLGRGASADPAWAAHRGLGAPLQRWRVRHARQRPGGNVR